MSRHEGVSCDSCLKGNFRGKRYKCLICYDYDLCATCYDAGATNTRHTTDHPMQCILTRMDFDLFYGGEAISIEQPQAFTCPFCGKMGFTETSLQDHVTAEHSDTSFEVVCPICAALPGGEPNHVTDDFASHLTLEHRSQRDLDEPSGSRHVRRVPHPSRGISGARSRRAHMQFSSSTGLASLSQSGVGGGSGSGSAGGGGGATGSVSTRDSMDPITELLSQLSGARRANANGLSQPSTTSQLHQLQMQLQLERQQAQAARQQLERLPRRQGQVTSSNAAVAAATAAAAAYSSNSAAAAAGGQSHYTILLESSPSPASNANSSQFLLSRCTDPTLTETEQQCLESERLDRSLFIQELILSTLSEALPSSSDSWQNLTRNLSQLTDNSIGADIINQPEPPLNNSIPKDSSNPVTNITTSNKDACCSGSTSSTATVAGIPPGGGLLGGSAAAANDTTNHTTTPSATCPLPQVTTVATTAAAPLAMAQQALRLQQNHQMASSACSSVPSTTNSSTTSSSVRVGSRKSSSNSRGLANSNRASASNAANGNVGQLSLQPQPQQPQLQQQVGSRGAGGGAGSTSSSGSLQRGSRDGLSLNSGVGGGSRGIGGRHTTGVSGGGGTGGPATRGGEGGTSVTSPSSTRRKVPRQMEDRNKSSEPPPPH